jgi:hypothetical protein
MSKAEEHAEREQLLERVRQSEADEFSVQEIFRGWQETVRPVREQHRRDLEQHTLAPCSADPLREEREAFLMRCGDHWDARAARAGEMGSTPIALWRALERDMDWLIRYQIHGHGWSVIGRGPAGAVHTPDAVRIAVQKLARVLSLRLRPGQRGGARRRIQPGRPRS